MSEEIDIPYNHYNIKYDGSYGIFINLKTKSGLFYLFVNLLIILFYFIPLIWIIKYRNWYIFKQRNFTLTFIGGIANFICTFTNSVTPILKLPCALAYYSATIPTSIMQACFVFRAFRLFILYKYNIFKVSSTVNKEKFIKKHKSFDAEEEYIEPNAYYKDIYNVVNKKLARIIMYIIVTIVTIVSVALHIRANIVYSEYGVTCGIKPVDINSKINGEIYGEQYMEQMKHNKTLTMNDNISTFSHMRAMFRIPEVLAVLFTILCLCITIIFTFTSIKDDKRFGIKFDCFSSAVISIIVVVLYFYLKFYMNAILRLDDNKDYTTIYKSHQVYLRTKQGIVLFVIIGLYIQLSSVIIPLIQCRRVEKMNNRIFDNSVESKETFLKVLSTPKFVEELKDIAIQEFSVENVLFWENYCTLQNLVRHVVAHHQSQDDGDKSIEYYGLLSMEDIFYSDPSEGDITSVIYDDESYDPRYPILPQLLPYFNNFYDTFIDRNAPARVKIPDNVLLNIKREFASYSTVGIFDEARRIVVENMYQSIYPIFLQQNRDQLGKIYLEV